VVRSPALTRHGSFRETGRTFTRRASAQPLGGTEFSEILLSGNPNLTSFAVSGLSSLLGRIASFGRGSALLVVGALLTVGAPGDVKEKFSLETHDAFNAWAVENEFQSYFIGDM